MSACIALRDIVPREVIFALGLMVVELIAQILQVWCCAEACEAVHQYAVDLQNHALACKKEARLIEDCVENIHKTRKACEDMLSVTGNALVMMDHAEVHYTRRK
ncbi:uncharacterized protein [Anabrus simplex]